MLWKEDGFIQPFTPFSLKNPPNSFLFSKRFPNLAVYKHKQKQNDTKASGNRREIVTNILLIIAFAI